MTSLDSPTPASNPESAPSLVVVAASPARNLAIWRWGPALTAGLAAGLIGWIITESGLTPGTELVRERGKNEPMASEVVLRDTRLCFGSLGALMGLGLGIAGGVSGRSARRAGLAGAVGLVLGGLAGAGLATWLVPVYFDNLNANDLTYSLKVNGGIWGGVGAAAGLAFGLGRRGPARMFHSAVAGLGTGLLAMALFVFAGSFLLPRAMVERPLPLTPESRLVGQLLLSLLVALGLVVSEGSRGYENN